MSASTTVAHDETGTAMAVLAAVSASHFLNDMIQSLLPAVYPLLKKQLRAGLRPDRLITLVFQVTASLLQPVVGTFTDRRPTWFSLPLGMGFTLCGLLLLSQATYPLLLLAAALIGTGSSVFHPESSRIARLASAAAMVLPSRSSRSAATSARPAVRCSRRSSCCRVVRAASPGSRLSRCIAIVILLQVGRWYQRHVLVKPKAAVATPASSLPRRKVVIAIGVLLALIFSKYFYLASLSTYYTFYLMERFALTAQDAQIHLFFFLGAVALGTLVGGPVGDRFGRKYVIWVSILGVLPFTLMLPHADLFWTSVLSVVIGLILSSAFSAILVYATELLPGNVGMIAGLFFGFAFGMGGLGAALLGELADARGIEYVYRLCAYLPAIGLLTVFLPNLHRRAAKSSA
jgi:FSR family fosmidomycin resistance protein-like MFS transporter